MKYRLPQNDDMKILKDYVEEHYSNYERTLTACTGMVEMDFNEWVQKVNKNVEIPDEQWGRYYQYLVFNDKDELVGMLNIRFDLSEEMRQRYGDIGYAVRPSKRRQGYASQMLEYALNVCKEKNMKEVILGCYKYNYGSNKIIQSHGGILYKTRLCREKTSQ